MKQNRNRRLRVISLSLLFCLGASQPGSGTVKADDPLPPASPKAIRLPDGRIQVGEVIYNSWIDYRYSLQPGQRGNPCGATSTIVDDGPRAASDCSLLNSSNLGPPNDIYNPALVKYRIPVVVHIMTNTAGDGEMTDSNVQGQIDILNEDFLAIPGSNGDGDGSTDVQIEFFLATTDPNGNEVNPPGIMRHPPNNAQFVDFGPGSICSYCSFSWDTDRYLNIYTVDFSDPSLLGYVPDFPATASFPGSAGDRVVVRWSAFGPETDDPFNNLGRTATHEVGHYLGLYHTFHPGDFSCPLVTQCSTNGDLICDTPPEPFPHFGCASGDSCPGQSGADDISNYMNYSDDFCMNHFTPQQARRLRCTLESYRSDLYEIANPSAGACCQLNQNCSVRTPQDCATIGGAFKGAGHTCTTGICSPDVLAGDDCDTAQTLTTTFFDSATTVGRANNYTGSTCGQLFGAESCRGPDVVYVVVVPGGGNVNVLLQPSASFDGSVYAITNCANPAASCVNGDDEFGEGGEEEFTFAAVADTPYYLIVDGFEGVGDPPEAGPFTLTVTIAGESTGACCLPNGACAVGTHGNCQAFGGTYKGNSTICAAVNCPTPPPTGGCCDPSGDCSIITAAQCSSNSGTYQGDFSLCSPNPCADPAGACCAPNDTCSETIRSACLAGGGTFIGANTTCLAPNCSDIPGACCMPDGSCNSVVFANCQTADGLFKGFSIACANANCPTPTGACCTQDAPCQLLTKAACDAETGTYQGNATSCTPNPCPAIAATGGCCDGDGVCTVLTQAACENLAHSYRGDGTQCTSGQCPTAAGACCFSGGACTVIAKSACESATGVFGGDGTNCADGCNDQCPDDPDKTAPGECGCGVPDDDSDGDGSVDCRDNCPVDANKLEPGTCGCGRPEVVGCPPDAPIGQQTPCCAASGAEATLAPFMLLGLGLIRRQTRRRRT